MVARKEEVFGICSSGRVEGIGCSTDSEAWEQVVRRLEEKTGSRLAFKSEDFPGE